MQASIGSISCRFLAWTEDEEEWLARWCGYVVAKIKMAKDERMRDNRKPCLIEQRSVKQDSRSQSRNEGSGERPDSSITVPILHHFWPSFPSSDWLTWSWSQLPHSGRQRPMTHLKSMGVAIIILLRQPDLI